MKERLRTIFPPLILPRVSSYLDDRYLNAIQMLFHGSPMSEPLKRSLNYIGRFTNLTQPELLLKGIAHTDIKRAILEVLYTPDTHHRRVMQEDEVFVRAKLAATAKAAWYTSEWSFSHELPILQTTNRGYRQLHVLAALGDEVKSLAAFYNLDNKKCIRIIRGEPK